MLLGKNDLFLFPSKTHKKFPSQEDKIGCLVLREESLELAWFGDVVMALSDVVVQLVDVLPLRILKVGTHEGTSPCD